MDRLPDSIDEGFVLGTPALVCRWRLAAGRLPLENRHMRAFGARTANGAQVSAGLCAWARQHVEWTLATGAASHPDGVLMVLVDEQGQAAMVVGPYEPLRSQRLAFLVHRAQEARAEAASTGVAPETLWAVRDGVLVYGGGARQPLSGCASLVQDLARTLGIPTRRQEGLPEELDASPNDYDEAFLVSDEHGVAPASDLLGVHGTRFAESYQKLLESEARKARRLS